MGKWPKNLPKKEQKRAEPSFSFTKARQGVLTALPHEPHRRRRERREEEGENPGWWSMDTVAPWRRRSIYWMPSSSSVGWRGGRELSRGSEMGQRIGCRRWCLVNHRCTQAPSLAVATATGTHERAERVRSSEMERRRGVRAICYRRLAQLRPVNRRWLSLDQATT